MNNSGKPISISIVGLGRAGWSLHLQPLLALSGFRIDAVADPLPERAQEARALTGCRTFGTLDELLAGSDCELVVIATPSASHFEDGKRVLEAGRHCILEKPMAMNLAEAEELVRVAKAQDRRLFVHHTAVHGAEYQHLREAIEGGLLGPVYQIRAFWSGYSRRWDWQTLKKNGGGTLNNTCPHVVSIVLPLLGARVERVTAELRNVKDAGDAEDHVEMMLQTGGGCSADVVVTTAAALGAPRWMLLGRHGALTCDGAKSRLRYYDPAAVRDLAVIDAAAPGRAYQSETLPWVEQEVPVLPTTTPSFHENVRAVLRDGAAQIVTPESAVEVIRILELARQAAQ